MKSDYRVRAMRMVDKLYFFMGEEIDNFDTISFRVFQAKLHDFNKKYNLHVRYSYGISRLCFMCSDYVIKFDYDVSDFGGCLSEYQNYQQVKTDGYEEYFAEITPYTIGEDCTAWIMPLIRGIGHPYNCFRNVPKEVVCYINKNFRDIHEFNYGLRDGHMVMIDYAASAFNK